MGNQINYWLDCAKMKLYNAPGRTAIDTEEFRNTPCTKPEYFVSLILNFKCSLQRNYTLEMQLNTQNEITKIITGSAGLSQQFA